MSNWKVSKEKIKLFAHPNADSLEIGKVGSYQVVVQKGMYKDGDEVIFVPEKSVLSGDLLKEFGKFLIGKDSNRVGVVRLRGEISSGLILPKKMINISDYELEVDISHDLGITKYVPEVPDELLGKAEPFDMNVGTHDCESVGVYINDLIKGERVVITEKLHGSQFILSHDFGNNNTIISSKNLLKTGLSLLESDDNLYWKASKNDDLIGLIKRFFDKGVVQIFGEVIPVQKGYNYGQERPVVKIFDIRVNDISIPYDQVNSEFSELWVPVVYDGTLQLVEKEVVIYEDVDRGIRKTRVDYVLPKDIIDLCKGNELVSGNSLHIREGVVLRPYIDRVAKDGTKIRLKIINPDYRETGEEFN